MLGRRRRSRPAGAIHDAGSYRRGPTIVEQGMHAPKERGARDAGDALSRHRFRGLVDPLTKEASFLSRPMFGCVGCYLNGRLVLVLADRTEPWQGLLVPTEKPLHASLLADFPALRVHPVLRKWLYVPHAAGGFAAASRAIVEHIVSGDRRFGVESALPRLPHRRMV